MDEHRDLGARHEALEPNDESVLVMAGHCADAGRLASLRIDYLDLKPGFSANPAPTPQFDVWTASCWRPRGWRSPQARNPRQRETERAHVIGFVDDICGLLGQHDVRLIAYTSTKAKAGERVGGERLD